VSEITVSLVEDAASPLLLHAIVNRGLFSEAVIARVDPDGTKSPFQDLSTLKALTVSPQ